MKLNQTRQKQPFNIKVKLPDITVATSVTATTTHMPYGITHPWLLIETEVQLSRVKVRVSLRMSIATLFPFTQL